MPRRSHRRFAALTALATSLLILATPAPSLAGPPCRCDWDGSGGVDSNDYFAFLADFFSPGGVDFNEEGTINSDDYFAFLECFFGGCPEPMPPSFAGDPNPNDPGERELIVERGFFTPLWTPRQPWYLANLPLARGRGV